MCIIVYKPKGVHLPAESILKTCYNNNDDGAGFMYFDSKNNIIQIKKGFDNFKAFYKKAKKLITDDTPAVLHFRISTQGGVKPELTHPYPVCDNYENMRKLETSCEVGLAHNGVISLTSEGYWANYGKKINYNDTMTFIKDYASLIITDALFYKDKNKIALLSRLAKSKLAILSNDGHCQLIGDFIFDDESKCYFSNTTYKQVAQVQNGWYDYYNPVIKKFSFYDDLFNCPCEATAHNLDYYCQRCLNYKYCKSKYKSKSIKNQ